MASRFNAQASAGISGYPAVYLESKLLKPPPSMTMVFLDESKTTINDGFFFLGATGDAWTDVPAAWHSRGCNFSFADGHAERWRWLDSRTPTLIASASTPGNPDLRRMQAAIPSD